MRFNFKNVIWELDLIWLIVKDGQDDDFSNRYIFLSPESIPLVIFNKWAFQPPLKPIFVEPLIVK